MFASFKKKISGKEFINVSFFSAISTAVKVLTSLILGKVVAVFLGPDGLALMGQLSNYVAVALVLSGVAFMQGIVKYVAEYNAKSPLKLPNLISTCFFLLLSCSLCVGFGSLLASRYLSIKLLHTEQYQSLFVIFSITVVFIIMNVLIHSLVNGFKQYKKYNIINISANIVGLIITILLVWSYGIFGALLSVMINQGVVLFITIPLVMNESWFKKSSLALSNFDSEILKKLMPFALLALFSAALMPIVTIIIRNILIEEISITAAGYYEFLNRVSSASLMFFGLSIATYYIPRISEISNRKELIQEVEDTYNVVIPLTGVLFVLIFLFREVIINVLSTSDFLPVSPLFKYQLIGDFFRVCAQVFSFILVAKAKIRLALFIEVVFNALHLALVYFLVDIYGTEGAIMAYMFLYILYFIVFIFIFKYNIINPEHYDS